MVNSYQGERARARARERVRERERREEREEREERERGRERERERCCLNHMATSHQHTPTNSYPQLQTFETIVVAIDPT